MPKTTKTKPATTKTARTNRFASYPDAELVGLTALWQKPSTRRAAQNEIDRRATVDDELDAVLLQIAKQHVRSDLETLEMRNSDSLDFFDCSAVGLRDALRAAYEAGRTAK